MIPAGMQEKINALVQPEDLEEAKLELEQMAAKGTMYLANDPAMRRVQQKTYALGIRLRKNRLFQPVQYVEYTPASVETEEQKAIRQEKRISFEMMGEQSIYRAVSYSAPETIQTKVIKYLFDEFHFTGKHNALLLGGTGSGKTYGAICYVSSNARLWFNTQGEARIDSTFIRAYTLSEYIQRKKWSELDELREKNWLIIDDLGIEGVGYKSTDFLSFFEDMFIERHETQKRTIMTCNATLEDVKTAFGARFISRLKETGAVFQTDDEDLRGKTNASI